MASLFQMNPFISPEQTLKTAQDHIELGKDDYSYSLLHEYIVGGKRKGNWSVTFEKLITLFIDLSLKLENYGNMKEALTQYRNLSQYSNITSLETVLVYYREKMEELFEKKILSKNISQLVEVEDFDLEESTEDIMIYSIEIKQKSQREELKTVLKNLLDTYKNIIDIVKRNKKLEDLLVSTSEKAYEFCLKYRRRNEFKRLSESFYTYLTKIILPPVDPSKKVYQVDITAHETNDRFLQISFKQLAIAFSFELWQEAFRTIESINLILNKRHKSPKPKLLSSYFDQLASVFWRSEYYLYHAYAFYQHFVIFKKFSKASSEEISQKTDYLVLSVLSIPPCGLENDQSEDNRRRLCKIVSSAGSVSSRADLISVIQTSNLLDLVSPSVRDLFILMEEKFSLLNFGSSAETLLKKMEENPIFNKFINQIKSNFAYKAIENASNVYKTMKILTLKRFLFFLNEDEIEKILLNTHIHEQIRVRINHEKKILIFNQMNTKADFSEASLHIVNFAYSVKEIVNSLTENSSDHSQQEKALKDEAREYLKNAEASLRERSTLIQNNQKKDPTVERQMQEQIEEQRREEKKKNEEEERRRKKEIEKREKESELLEISIKKKEKILQEIIKIKANQIVKIDGKRIEQIKREDLKEIEEATLTELKTMIQNREKENTENKFKRAFQRADFIERARREEEIKILRENFKTEDLEIPKILTAYEEVFKKNKALQLSLMESKAFKEKFLHEELKKREEKFKADISAFKMDIDKNYREKVLTLAKTKLKDNQKKMEEESKRLKEEEEKKKKEIEKQRSTDRERFSEIQRSTLSRQDRQVDDPKNTKGPSRGNFNRSDNRTDINRSDNRPDVNRSEINRSDNRPDINRSENRPDINRSDNRSDNRPDINRSEINRSDNRPDNAADNKDKGDRDWRSNASRPAKESGSNQDEIGPVRNKEGSKNEGYKNVSGPFTHPGRNIDSGPSGSTSSSNNQSAADTKNVKAESGPRRFISNKTQGGPSKEGPSREGPRKEPEGEKKEVPRNTGGQDKKDSGWTEVKKETGGKKSLF